MTPNGNVARDLILNGRRDIFRIKKELFGSCIVVGFILSMNEKFYLTNKKTREMLGDVIHV